MHPVGTNSAASFPKISAARVSSRFTVGSSPYTSSPTSAAAIAARISAEGRVNVSLRNSTAPATGLARFSSITTSVLVSVATFLLFPVRLLRALCAPTSTPCLHAVLLNSFTLTLLNSSTSSIPQTLRSTRSPDPAPIAPSSHPAQPIQPKSIVQIATPTKHRNPSRSAPNQSRPTAATPKTIPPPKHSPQSIFQSARQAIVPPKSRSHNPPRHEH